MVPKEANHSAEPFASTTEYYARCRRPYPPGVVASIVSAFGLDGRGRLMDAGCGAGQVFAVLAQYFEETIAFDPDADMVTFAKRWALEQRLSHVRVLQMRAEDVAPALGPFRLVAFGNSFHWTDRQRVAELVYERLEDGGHLVLLCGGGPLGRTTWEGPVDEVIARWVDPDRRAGCGAHRQREFHQDVLARTRFGRPNLVDVTVEETWSIDDVVGYLYSTSFASKAMLGDRAVGFEKDLRRTLNALEPGGQFHRTVDYTILSVRK